MRLDIDPALRQAPGLQRVPRPEVCAANHTITVCSDPTKEPAVVIAAIANQLAYPEPPQFLTTEVTVKAAETVGTVVGHVNGLVNRFGR